MKSSVKLLSTSISSIIALGILAGFTTKAGAADFVWNGNGGTWDDGVTAYWNSPTTVVWANVATSTAKFTGGSGTVIIGSPLTIGALEFSGSNTAYIFDNSGQNQLDFYGPISSTATGISAVQLFNSDNASIYFHGITASAGDSTITLTGTGGGSLTFDDANAGDAKINLTGSLNFINAASAAGSTISSSAAGTITFDGTSNGGTATIINGGQLDFSLTTASNPLTLKKLTNANGGSGGDVYLGSHRLELGVLNDSLTGLSLAGAGGQRLNFDLNSPSTSGKIKLLGGTSILGADPGQVSIEAGVNSIPSGFVYGTAYTLIDWSALNPTQDPLFNGTKGIDFNDFSLDQSTLPLALVGSTLRLDSDRLVLVAVPEPSSLVMPFAAVLGMVWMRRRTARMAAL